jgi:hypothetical protein
VLRQATQLTVESTKSVLNSWHFRHLQEGATLAILHQRHLSLWLTKEWQLQKVLQKRKPLPLSLGLSI